MERISTYSIMDFARMNDNFSAGRGYVYLLENGNIRHDLPDGFSLTYEGDGIIRVQFEGLQDWAFDEHGFYGSGYQGIAFPRRCLELYKRLISTGRIGREETP